MLTDTQERMGVSFLRRAVETETYLSDFSLLSTISHEGTTVCLLIHLDPRTFQLLPVWGCYKYSCPGFIWVFFSPCRKYLGTVMLYHIVETFPQSMNEEHIFSI